MIRSRVRLDRRRREGLLRDLRRVLGARRVRTDPAALYAYSGTATTTPRAMPDVVAIPSAPEEVPGVLAAARRWGAPVTPVASGTQEPGTHPFFGGIVLDLMGMRRIEEVNLAGGTALVQSGVTVGQLARRLARDGRRIPVGSFPPGVSVVGNYTQVAVNSHRSSGILDDVVTLEVVLPDGRILRTGSAAYADGGPPSWHATTSGFPDLRGLFMNAAGTLGVITRASVRIYDLGEAQAVPIQAFDDYRSAVTFMERATRANLCQHISTWHWALYTIIDHLETYGRGSPGEVVVSDPWEPPDDRPYTLVVPTVAGFREDVEVHRKVLDRLARELGGRPWEEECRKRFPGAFRFFEDHYALHRPTNTFMGGYAEGIPMMPIVFADPRRVADLEHWGIRFLRKSPLKLGLTYYSHSVDQNRAIFLRMTPFIFPAASPAEIRRAVEARARYMKRALARYGGVPIRPSYDQPPGATLRRTGPYGEVLRAMKRTIDPENLMNPGMSIAMYGRLG